jgi:hypothetical protein
MSALQTRRVIEGYLGQHGSEWLAEAVEFFEPAASEPHRGRSDVAQWLAGFYGGAFDEATAEPVALVVDDERAGYEFVFSGVHRGSLFGETPTGRVLRVPMAVFYQVKDGEIVAGRLYYDTASMRTQLGPPGHPAAINPPRDSILS